MHQILFDFSSPLAVSPQVQKEEDVDEGITLGTWVKVSLLVGWRLICASLHGGRRLIRCSPDDLG